MAFDNNCSFTGNLAKDVDFTVTPEGLAIAKFSIAVDNGKDGQGNKKKPTYVNFTAFRKAAEAIANFTSTGSKIGIRARYETGSYMKGEQKIYTHDFIVEEYKFLSPSKKNNQQLENQPTYQQNQPPYNNQPTYQQNQPTYQQNQPPYQQNQQQYGEQTYGGHQPGAQQQTYQQNQPPYTNPNLNGAGPNGNGDDGLPF